MSITSPVVMLILTGALLHASWNVLIKSSTDKVLQGARQSGNVAQYIALLIALDGWLFGGLVLAQRKGRVWHYTRRRWPLASAGALASLGSYSISLWAMTVAPVAVVAALRETSVLFAVILGATLLRERWTGWRIAGTLGIVAGVVTLRLG